MLLLSFKEFVFPQNPHTYQEKSFREPHFHTESGTTYYDGMGKMQRIISGSGTFCGEDAYAQFKQLQLLMENGEPGNLEHPIWGIRKCYLTKLEMTQEARENVVSYNFEFTQIEANGTVPR